MSDLFLLNTIHFKYNNCNNEMISSSRHSQAASCAVVVTGHQCSTNENISSSSLSASAPLSNHYWFVLHSEKYHPELNKKSFTTERQKNVRNGWDESLGLTSVNEYFHLICINIRQQQKLSHISSVRPVTVNLRQKCRYDIILINVILIQKITCTTPRFISN